MEVINIILSWLPSVNDNTVSVNDLYSYSTKFVIIFLGIFFISKLILPGPKQLSWVLGFVNSITMLIAFVLYLSAKGSNILSHLVNFESIELFVHSSNDFSSLCCLWFAIGMVLDIICGLIFYPKYVGLLTGWIHHTVYTWVMLTAISGDGYFTTCRPFAPLFVLMSIEELPTFLLALGSINSNFRTDLGFGISFLITRLLFHFLALGYLWYSNTDAVPLIVVALASGLHLQWFYGWATKYSSYKVKASKKLH